MNIFIYQSDGNPQGPYALVDIPKLLEEGTIQLDDEAWCDELEGRHKVKDLPDLLGSQPNTPAPTQPLAATGQARPNLPPPPAHPPHNEEAPPKFIYSGEGGEFFKLNLVNILLTLCTLGVYAFWAKAKVRQFHWGHTQFMEEPFEYHATGKELFVGFLKGMLILIPFILIVWLLVKFLEMPGIEFLFLYLFMFISIPFQVHSKWKFQSARTSWRNVRFKFTGKLGECYKLHIKGLLLTTITFGFYYPWFKAALERYLAGKASYGTAKFEYHGKGDELMVIYFKGILLSIITFGIYSSWFMASLQRYKWNNTTIDGIRFKNTIQGEDILVNLLLTILIIAFSFGVAFPWAIVWLLRLKFKHLSLESTPDLAAIEAAMRDQKASSIGEGLGEAADAIGEMFGG